MIGTFFTLSVNRMNSALQNVLPSTLSRIAVNRFVKNNFIQKHTVNTKFYTLQNTTTALFSSGLLLPRLSSPFHTHTTLNVETKQSTFPMAWKNRSGTFHPPEQHLHHLLPPPHSPRQRSIRPSLPLHPLLV